MPKITPDELAALYVAADVMLVTPLRDGMNLVAKEFVAAREDERGVLVLSHLLNELDDIVRADLAELQVRDGRLEGRAGGR